MLYVPSGKGGGRLVRADSRYGARHGSSFAVTETDVSDFDDECGGSAAVRLGRRRSRTRTTVVVGAGRSVIQHATAAAAAVTAKRAAEQQSANNSGSEEDDSLLVAYDSESVASVWRYFGDAISSILGARNREPNSGGDGKSWWFLLNVKTGMCQSRLERQM